MKYTAFIIAAFALFFSVPSTAHAEAVMTKEQVEKIVHDYIMNHADVVLTAVETHRRKEQVEQQSAALKANKGMLFNDNADPFTGKENGDITVIEFFDYNCHFCKKAFEQIQSIIDADKNVKVVFKEFPILSQSSEDAAKWALAAHKQGKYFAFHQKLMEHQGSLSANVFEDTAKEVGLDVKKAKTDIGKPEITLQLEKNRALANQLGIGGTPAFIIGEQLFSGIISEEEFKAAIAEARKSAKK